MKYSDINDNELIYLIKENDDEAKDIIYDKYKYIIDILTKKYKKSAYVLGIEFSDLYQDAMLGFVDAIYSYNDEKASIKTYITLCVERKIYSCLKKATRLKNKIHHESLSLEYTYEDDNSLKDILSDNNKNNPLENIITMENQNEVIDKIKEVLSDSEKLVFSLMIGGLYYKQIAKILDLSPKQVDNTRNRIRNKAKKVLFAND